MKTKRSSKGAKFLFSDADLEHFVELYTAADTGSPDEVKPETVGALKQASDAFKDGFKRVYSPPAGDVEARRNLGVIYRRLGWYREAVDILKQAISYEPDDIKAHYLLGLSYFGLKATGLALEEYKILKSLDPEFAEELFDEIDK